MLFLKNARLYHQCSSNAIQIISEWISNVWCPLNIIEPANGCVPWAGEIWNISSSKLVTTETVPGHEVLFWNHPWSIAHQKSMPFLICSHIFCRVREGKKKRALTDLHICCLSWNVLSIRSSTQIIISTHLPNFPSKSKTTMALHPSHWSCGGILRSLPASERPHFLQPLAKTTPPAQVRWQKIRWPPSPQGFFFKTKNRPWPKRKREIVFQTPFLFSGCVSFREGGMQSANDQVVPEKKKVILDKRTLYVQKKKLINMWRYVCVYIYMCVCSMNVYIMNYDNSSNWNWLKQKSLHLS